MEAWTCPSALPARDSVRSCATAAATAILLAPIAISTTFWNITWRYSIFFLHHHNSLSASVRSTRTSVWLIIAVFLLNIFNSTRVILIFRILSFPTVYSPSREQAVRLSFNNCFNNKNLNFATSELYNASCMVFFDDSWLYLVEHSQQQHESHSAEIQSLFYSNYKIHL